MYLNWFKRSTGTLHRTNLEKCYHIFFVYIILLHYNSFQSALNSSTSVFSLDSAESELLSSDTLGDLLTREFRNATNHLNVCYRNAKSIPSHYNDLFDTFSSFNIHAIIVSESWFKPNLASTSSSLPGFVLIQNDCTGKSGGGDAIYLRINISFEMIYCSLSI